MTTIATATCHSGGLSTPILTNIKMGLARGTMLRTTESGWLGLLIAQVAMKKMSTRGRITGVLIC